MSQRTNSNHIKGEQISIAVSSTINHQNCYASPRLKHQVSESNAGQTPLYMRCSTIRYYAVYLSPCAIDSYFTAQINPGTKVQQHIRHFLHKQPKHLQPRLSKIPEPQVDRLTRLETRAGLQAGVRQGLLMAHSAVLCLMLKVQKRHPSGL
jgi:hypothetical protein